MSCNSKPSKVRHLNWESQGKPSSHSTNSNVWKNGVPDHLPKNRSPPSNADIGEGFGKGFSKSLSNISGAFWWIMVQRWQRILLWNGLPTTSRTYPWNQRHRSIQRNLFISFNAVDTGERSLSNPHTKNTPSGFNIRLTNHLGLVYSKIRFEGEYCSPHFILDKFEGSEFVVEVEVTYVEEKFMPADEEVLFRFQLFLLCRCIIVEMIASSYNNFLLYLKVVSLIDDLQGSFPSADPPFHRHIDLHHGNKPVNTASESSFFSLRRCPDIIFIWSPCCDDNNQQCLSGKLSIHSCSKGNPCRPFFH